MRLLERESDAVQHRLGVELAHDLHRHRQDRTRILQRWESRHGDGECRQPGLALARLCQMESRRTMLKHEVLSDTPAELTISSRALASSAGSFGARNGMVGRTRTSYLSSAA